MYWALQTLRQLEKKKGKKSLFAGCEIVDWPAFRIRGFMQDVGRSYISVEELKREIEIDTAVRLAFSKGDAEHPVCGGIGGIR